MSGDYDMPKVQLLNVVYLINAVSSLDFKCPSWGFVGSLAPISLHRSPKKQVLLSKSAASSLCLSQGSHGSSRCASWCLSTPPWGKLVLKLSPLGCSEAKLRILGTGCLSVKQSCAMDAQDSKLEGQEKAKCLCKARS